MNRLNQKQRIIKAQEWLDIWRNAGCPDLTRVDLKIVPDQFSLTCIQIGQSDFFFRQIGNANRTGHAVLEILAKGINVFPLMAAIHDNRIYKDLDYLVLPWETLLLQKDHADFVMHKLIDTHITAAKRCVDLPALRDCKGPWGVAAFAELEKTVIASELANPKRGHTRTSLRM